MSALSSRLLVFVLASFLLVGTTSSVVGIGYVKAEDSSGSSSGSSDSGSGGDSGSSNGGGSSDSNSGGSSNDKGSNDNNNNDNGDKGPKGPSKEDTKDLTSDDPNVEPNIPKTPEVCAGSCGPFNENPNNPVKPLPIVDPNPNPNPVQPCIFPGGCVHPPHPIHTGPHCPPGFHWKHGVCNKNIVINVHTHNHSSGSNSNSNSGSEISDNCYSQIKIAWIGKIQRGSNQAVDSIIDRCMGLA